MFDYGVSKRQEIGHWWISKPDDLERARSTVNGTLSLDPHPDFLSPPNIDWDADPFSQKNWRFQLHCLKWLEPVRRVAMSEHAFSAKAASFWNTTVTSWVDAHLESEDQFAWMDMADGLRTIEIVLGAPLARGRLESRLGSLLRVHVEHLSDPTNRATGNHALHQLQGLFVGACFLQDEELKERATVQLFELFDSEYDNQGTNLEGSVSYHDLNYFWWRQSFERLTAEGFAISSQTDRLQLARQSIVHFVRPDGFLEMIGDTSDFKVLSKDGRQQTLFVTSQGKEGQPPEPETLDLEAGYSLGRSGWGTGLRDFAEETFFSVRYGQTPVVHGHNDSGSISIHANGEPWIVDTGMYAYQNHKFRNYFLSRMAHNTVVAKGLSEVPDLPELVHVSHSSICDSYTIECKPYSEFTFRRHVVFLRQYDCFVIADRIIPDSENVVIPEFSQRWNFHPDTSLDVGRSTAILRRDSKQAVIRWLDRPRLESNQGREQPLAGWYSARYGEAVPTWSLDAYPTRRGELSWVAVVSVGDFDLVPSSLYRDGGNRAFELSEGGLRILVTVDDGGAEIWHRGGEE